MIGRREYILPSYALEEFHQTFDGDDYQGTRAPGPITDRNLLELRKTLLREEFEELMEALDEDPNDPETYAHQYKELGDLLYVLYGLDLHMGQRLDKVFKIVHDSNMSKVWPDGTVRRREDGKILKPPTYQAPNLDKALE